MGKLIDIYRYRIIQSGYQINNTGESIDRETRDYWKLMVDLMYCVSRKKECFKVILIIR
jgi:hypothetical protein